MATSSDDSSATESFEPTESIFCAIHVTNTKSKVVSFTDKSHQKCRECAAKWISVEDGVECTVAEKFLDHLHRSEGVGPGQSIRVRTGVEESGEDAAAVDFTSRSGR